MERKNFPHSDKPLSSRLGGDVGVAMIWVLESYTVFILLTRRTAYTIGTSNGLIMLCNYKLRKQISVVVVVFEKYKLYSSFLIPQYKQPFSGKTELIFETCQNCSIQFYSELGRLGETKMFGIYVPASYIVSMWVNWTQNVFQFVLFHRLKETRGI